MALYILDAGVILELKSIKYENGFSLMDILHAIFDYISSITLPNTVLVYLLEKLSNIE
jgi:hypothetical protein